LVVAAEGAVLAAVTSDVAVAAVAAAAVPPAAAAPAVMLAPLLWVHILQLIAVFVRPSSPKL
jgi:hypothetical protein